MKLAIVSSHGKFPPTVSIKKKKKKSKIKKEIKKDRAEETGGQRNENNKHGIQFRTCFEITARDLLTV